MMKSFSQRLGLKPIRSAIQREAADDVLRNHLWNAINVFYLNKFRSWTSDCDSASKGLITRIWVRHYNSRIDELPSKSFDIVNKLKSDFLGGSWNEMFDILEFIPNNFRREYPGDQIEQINVQFYEYVNGVLKENLSAYRFVDNVLTEIHSEAEIQSIEQSLEDTSKFATVQTHLRRALELYADRKNPDYRNSIKESISGVEAFSSIITGNSKATLGQALKEIEKNHSLHPALKNSFTNLYGYTSDGDGIRHALLDESTLQQEDAKFMLVACSAFVNYLLVKSSELGSNGR